MIGGGGGRDIENALSSGQKRRGRDRAEPRDPRRRGRRPRAMVRRPVLAARRVAWTIGDGRSTLAERDTKYDVIHIGFTDTLSANSAAGFALTEDNLYTRRGVRGVLRPPEARRHPERDAAAPAGRRRGAARDRARARGPEARGRRAPRAQRRRDARPRHLQRAVRHGAGPQASRGPAPSSRASGGSREERGDGVAFAPGGPYKLEWAELARRRRPRALLPRLPARRLPADRRQAVLLQHDAAVGARSRSRRAGYFFATDPLRILAVTLGILAVLSRARVRAAAHADAARHAAARLRRCSSSPRSGSASCCSRSR